MRVKKQQLELHMIQWTGSKLGKEYVKTVYGQTSLGNATNSAAPLAKEHIIDSEMHRTREVQFTISQVYLVRQHPTD